MTKKLQRCPACERGALVPRSVREPMPFRHAPSVLPAWPIAVPTCDQCGERFIDSATAKAWDEALEAALAERQREVLVDAIERLGAVRSQREWERRLGLSPGYLSRLKTGKESSVVLTTLLAVLARTPAESWAQVSELWSMRESASAPPEAWAQTRRYQVHLVASPPTSITVSAPMRKVQSPEAISVLSEAA